MYIPENMLMSSTDIYQFIEEYSFAVIISESLEATHLPFILDRSEGEKGTLYCHFARANPHWQKLNGQKVLIIFSGPHAYISPTWYAATPAVPTWNYAAVHVYGQVEVLPDSKTLAVIDNMVNHYEPNLSNNQPVISDEYKDRLVKNIVAVKIKISRFEAKQKLGQHRKIEDQQGVLKALQSSDQLDAKGLLNYMFKSGVGV